MARLRRASSLIFRRYYTLSSTDVFAFSEILISFLSHPFVPGRPGKQTSKGGVFDNREEAGIFTTELTFAFSLLLTLGFATVPYFPAGRRL